jgi:protein-L-isoaspartate(D-aspartate) O-methyltransferase
MAWQCSAHSNHSLVTKLIQSGLLRSSNVISAMQCTARGNYCAVSPYSDSPQPIGFGQTISAPHMHAAALESAHDLYEGARVLDVGSGSGYLSACFSRLVGMTGKVVGIDCIPELVTLSIENVKKDDGDLFNNHVLTLRVGDGWSGAPNEAPFDFIHVGAAAPSVPQALMDQLKDGGKMFIPVGNVNEPQFVMEIERRGAQFYKKHLMSVSYVPLVRLPHP